jgi:hypothetical protein
MNKDWSGDARSIFTCNGARNFAAGERAENDYYATEPRAVEELLKVEDFYYKIWEPACGEGHISNVLLDWGKCVRSTDIIDRGYKYQTHTLDFLACLEKDLRCDIITNPPYKYAKEFVEKALDVVADGQKVAMFLKLTFLEGASRGALLDNSPPKYLYPARKRLICAKNGEFEKITSSAVAYGWFVWEKGYKGPTIIKGYINKGD